MSDIIHAAQTMPRIQALLAWQFGIDAAVIHPHMDLIDDLYADSLDLLETTQLLNSEFDIEIDPDYLAGMRTVADAASVVTALLNVKVDAAAAALTAIEG